MKTILLIGKNGQVGWELQSALTTGGKVMALDRGQMDLTQADAIRNVVRQAAPDVIVNAAGYTSVDKAQSEPALAMQVNAAAPAILAQEARRIGALLVHYSTDYVYDGMRSAPYVEDDAPNPLNAYGKSKLEGEKAIAEAGCAHLILRTSWIYSAHHSNFVLTMLRLAREQKEIAVVDDQIGSPTAAGELAKATAQLIARFNAPGEQSGIYHLSAEGYTSRYNFANKIIETAMAISGDPGGWALVRPTSTADYPLPAQRPLNVRTSKEKVKRVFGVAMPDWKHQLEMNLKPLMRRS